jgi:hypothetical protein
MRGRNRAAVPFRWIVLLVVVLAPPGAAAHSAPAPSMQPPDGLQLILDETARGVAAWERRAGIPVAIGFAVGVAAVAAAAFRRFRCRGCRSLAAVFGIGLCLLTLAADGAAHRQFQARKLHAQSLIQQVRRQLTEYDPAQAAANQRQWKEELLARFREIWDLRAALAAGEASLELATPVSADSDRPAWLLRPPAAGTNLYFVSTGRSSSLETARKESLDNAMAEALVQVAIEYSAGGRRRSDPLHPDRLRRYVRQSCVVEGVWFTYDHRMREFHYHTLLRLNRMLARPEVVRAFAG